MSSWRCPRCGSYHTVTGEDTHGRYWRCRTCGKIEPLLDKDDE